MLRLLLIIPFLAIILWLMLSVRPRIKEKKRQKRLELFNRLKPEVEKAFTEIKSLYNFNHYITETERLSLLEDYRDLDSEVQPVLNSKEIEEFMHKDVFRRFHTAMTDTTEHKKSNNRHFVDKVLGTGIFVDNEEHVAGVETDATLQVLLEVDVARHCLAIAVECKTDKFAITIDNRAT